MPPDLPTLDLRTRRQWRAWLAKNHAASSGIWLVFHKKHTGIPCIPYDEAVREALCFGWIDSIVKRVDGDRYVQKFTPRKATSGWSASNRKRWAELKEQGLLAPAGLAAAPTDKISAPPKIDISRPPPEMLRALKANPKAWRFFQALAPSYQRRFVGWIAVAKRPETRDARIRESIALLSAGKRLGLK